MIARFLRHIAAALLFISGSAAFTQTYIPPPPGYTPPPGPWAIFDFTTGSNTNVQNGNSRTYQAYSALYGTFNLRVTAWSLQKVCTAYSGSHCIASTNYVRDSKLMVYDGGLGVISDDDDGGANNQHTIDNEGGKDFIMLQFDRPVALVGALFNTFSVLGAAKDSDITVKYGNTNIAWNGSLTSTLNDKTEAQLNALFNGSYEATVPTGESNFRYINLDNQGGNMWLIGASFFNADNKTDGFKLQALAVVPEPQTWAMLIAGFGLIGGAMRLPRRRVAISA